jgi:hypothetical protein
MSDQQEVQRQVALRLRDMASRFLGSVVGIDDPELRRKLTRWAFELVQEAVAIVPIEDHGEPGSLSSSGMSNPAAPAGVPVHGGAALARWLPERSRTHNQLGRQCRAQEPYYRRLVPALSPSCRDATFVESWKRIGC